MKNKRVFVSGGAGVIGRPLVGKLLQLGAHVFVADLKPEPKEWPKNVQYWQGDINHLDGEKLLSFDPEICFHLAATFERSEESVEFIEENFYHNILLSHALLHALQKCSHLKRVIFASSYLVYDPEFYFLDRSLLVAGAHPVELEEKSPLNPRNLCGMAKLLHEKELDFIARLREKRHPFSVVSARIFRVYGKGSRDVISRWVKELLKGNTLTIYGKEALFDYIFADDAAEGLLRLAESKGSGVVNLGKGEARRVSDLLKILSLHFKEMRVQEEKREEESEGGGESVRLEASQANMEKFRALTGWTPRITLEKGISKIIAYEKEQN